MLALLLLLLSCLTVHSWPFRADQDLSQASPLSDEDEDIGEDPQLLKWLKRPPIRTTHFPEDDMTTYLSGLRYLRAAQKRFKPKIPIFLGLIGKR